MRTRTNKIITKYECYEEEKNNSESINRTTFIHPSKNAKVSNILTNIIE